MIFQALITMFVAFVCMGLNYVFHFFMARLLSPVIYGELAVIIGILSVLLVPTSSIQTLLTREIAKLDKKHNEKVIICLIKEYSKIVFLGGIFVGIILFFSSYLIARVFNNSQLISPIQIVALEIPFAFLLPVLRAYYQGKERILRLSVILVSEPFLKVIFALSLVLLGFGLVGVTFSLLVGPLLLSFLIIPIVLNKSKSLAHSLNLSKSFFLILFTSVLIMLFLYLDLFFVRYYLGSEQAGYYNIASITSKVLFYAASGINLVFLPKSSKLNIHKDKKRIKSLLFKSFLLMLPIFILFISFPGQIISIFYTEKYLGASTPFVILSIGIFALGIYSVFLNFLWSQRMEKISLVLSAALVFTDILLLIYLTPTYGLVGASIATTFSAILFLLISLFVIGSYLRK